MVTNSIVKRNVISKNMSSNFRQSIPTIFQKRILYANKKNTWMKTNLFQNRIAAVTVNFQRQRTRFSLMTSDKNTKMDPNSAIIIPIKIQPAICWVIKKLLHTFRTLKSRFLCLKRNYHVKNYASSTKKLALSSRRWLMLKGLMFLHSWIKKVGNPKI